MNTEIQNTEKCGQNGSGRGAGAGDLEADKRWRRMDWIEEVEPWPEPVDGTALLDALQALLSRFVVLPQWAPEMLALWILHTYAFELRDVSTYLGIESPEKRCGKTTLLTVLSGLVNRPVVASNISSPALFRVIEETRPTLLIDEADTLLQGNDELRGILNSGYGKKTAFVVRVASQGNICDSRWRSRGPGEGAETEARAGGAAEERENGNGTRLAMFSCWCPKAIAAIGRLPETLADRCIAIRMQRKTPNEQCERLRNLETTELRRKCVRFVADEAGRIAAARPQLPDRLHDRAADIWEPLLVLAELAGGEWPERARQAAAGLTARTQESDPMGALLWDIMKVFLALTKGRIFSRELVECLGTFSERPWMGMKGGRGVTELWLAQRLRPYGIQSRTIRIDEERAKGYLQADFADTFRRYIPRSELEAQWRDADRHPEGETGGPQGAVSPTR